MPGADKWYHIILHNMRDGETFGECEMRLRSYVATGEAVKMNWQGRVEEYIAIAGAQSDAH